MTTKKRGSFVLGAALLVLSMFLGGVSRADAQPMVDGYAAIETAGTGGLVAIKMDLAPGEALTGIRWVNSDELADLAISVVGTDASGMPAMSSTTVPATVSEWASEAWIDAGFEQTVTSFDGSVYVVFAVPPTSTDGIGFGTGARLGYRVSEEVQVAMLGDGSGNWTQLAKGFQFAVEAVTTMDTAQVVMGAMARSLQAEPQETPDAVDQHPGVRLEPAQPNPFNPQTTISFRLGADGNVNLSIFDSRGRRVRTLREEVYRAGAYRITWDGTDASGQSVSSGVYFAVLRASAGTESQRLLLVK